jgi:NDP-sugar pyrophosphorylase family protein
MKKPVAGVINAGGKGTRLHPITLEIPKPLLTVGRKPIIQYLVELLRTHRIHPIYITVNQDDVSLFERWKDEYKNDEVIFVIEQDRMGTWGGIRKFLSERSHSGTFVVTNGDELKEMDVTQLVAFHKKSEALVTLGTVQVDDPSNYGVIEAGPHGKVKAFHYKPQNPPTNHIMSGIYVAEPDIFKILPDEKVISFEEQILPTVIELGKLYECHIPGRWNDTGTFERYEQAIRTWAK